jgi:hypothetical protein
MLRNHVQKETITRNRKMIVMRDTTARGAQNDQPNAELINKNAHTKIVHISFA